MQLTAQGTVEDFDQARLQASLGAHLGVPPADIRLSVSAASVSVVATITFADASVASSVIDTLQGLTSDLAALSAAVGITVEGATGPVVSKVLILAPSPPPPTSPELPSKKEEDGVSVTLIHGGIIGGLGGACLLAAVVCGIFYLKKKKNAVRSTGAHAGKCVEV